MVKFSEKNDYVEILKEFITTNLATRGYQSLLAKAANCHVSHLSHVLNGRAHLNLEQALAICEFWELGDLDTDYFINLVNLARAGTPRLREKFEKDGQRLRLDYVRTVSTEEKGVVLLTAEQSEYFLSAWFVPAIHAALALPEFRTIESLSTRFGLSDVHIASVLQKLQEFNLVKVVSNQWTKANSFALSGDSMTNTKTYHSLSRLRATQVLAKNSELNFFETHLIAFSKPKITVFRSRLETVLKSVLEDAGGNSDEGGEIAFLNIDFFVP